VSSSSVATAALVTVIAFQPEHGFHPGQLWAICSRVVSGHTSAGVFGHSDSNPGLAFWYD